MLGPEKDSSESDTDELDWSLKKRKKDVSNPKDCVGDSFPKEHSNSEKTNSSGLKIFDRNERFQELRRKSDDIKAFSAHRLQVAEKRRSKKLIKKALKDPFIRQLVLEENSSVDDEKFANNEEKEEWDELKPYLNVNSHLHGPVSHGVRGPKSELETIIDDAIKEGDFEKAELISDTLANKEFAGKICKAFSAKRCHEQQEKLRNIEKFEQKKKIRWMFETKEKWQMKGNM